MNDTGETRLLSAAIKDTTDIFQVTLQVSINCLNICFKRAKCINIYMSIYIKVLFVCSVATL